MHKAIDTTPKLFDPAEAEHLAAEMAGSDPDWTYTADHDPKGTGYSRVVVHDEDGEFVSYL